MEPLFFDGWRIVLRTLAVGALAYVGLVVLLRVSGNRTLSKMNAFDLVITVALGSTLATILLNANVALAEGMVALALLVGLQFLVTWSSVRVPWIRRVVTGEPVLLFRAGRFEPSAMRRARVTHDEIRAAARASGHADLGTVAAVVMETDGSFSVVGQDGTESASALEGVATPDGKQESRIES